MDAQRFYLASQTVGISENKLYLELQNRLCYYGEPNLNDVVLPIEGAYEKAQSLIDMPVVAKYRVNGDGKPDLGGHEAYVDPISGEIKFDTECVGTHVSVEIKDDLVEVNGEQKVLPCLFATARVWKRNKNMIEAIKRLYAEGNLYTSWEISVSSYEYDNGIKILSDYLFEGNCLLGEGVLPAYGKTSVVLDVASKKESELLVAEALAKDIVVAGDSKEEAMEEEKRIEEAEVVNPYEASEVNEEVVEETAENEKPSEEEVSELPAETSEEANEESAEETDVTEEVEEDPAEEEQEESSEESEPEVDYQAELAKATEEIAKLTEALNQAAENFASLKEELDQLKEYKTLYDEAQAEKEAKEKEEKVRELSAKALKSKMISEDELQNDEVIKKMVSELDETGIKNLIATRYMESLENEPEHIEATRKLPTRALDEEAAEDGRSFYRAYLSN